ncbi:response regulator [Methanoculleus sp. YWC-01]|jgi:CheY-like chemotaxis protein|uniref:Response regulator n=1 Tax=Methanoculleus nereidis TaxID=2735141 RepID=A0ABU3Z1T9_9EURY|nr:response regulator [Methanoculleus sp. YWC-01]MCK9298146.1 response regulator [Methanoculleus sp.]MDV4342777.1 response regulator [Methanoculleus sp. YWC-01]PKL56895.1 MAG: response regulator [Methanomicrobiales archaeon HGW-Methanomicrobiales-6]
MAEVPCRRIMVVDDDVFILEVMKELFEPEGIGVVTAESGDACIRELEKGFRGVILMDIMMPQKDGWETIEEMIDRGLMEGNIVAMLTAKDVPDGELDYLKEHVIDYITKPFEANEIIAIVKGYLDYLA